MSVEHGERLLRTFENGSATVRVHVASPTYKTEIERQRRIDDFHRFLAALIVEDKRQQMQQTSVE